MREVTLTRPYVWTKTSTSASLAMLKLPQKREFEQKPSFACVNVLTADLSLSQPGYKLSHHRAEGFGVGPPLTYKNQPRSRSIPASGKVWNKETRLLGEQKRDTTHSTTLLYHLRCFTSSRLSQLNLHHPTAKSGATLQQLAASLHFCNWHLSNGWGLELCLAPRAVALGICSARESPSSTQRHAQHLKARRREITPPSHPAETEWIPDVVVALLQITQPVLLEEMSTFSTKSAAEADPSPRTAPALPQAAEQSARCWG